LQDSYARMRQVALFDGIPSEDLVAALAAGGLRYRAVRRDLFIADPIHEARHELFFLMGGQLSVSVFDPEVFAHRRQEQDRFDAMTEKERKEQSALTPPPLARVARKNLAAFMAGDLFNAAALPTVPEAVVAFFATSPTELAIMNPATAGDLVRRFGFFEKRLRRALELGRERLHGVAGVKQEILDFFVRQGLSVSGPMVRVRQLDLCIDCKQCEMACEDRYGAKRLTLGGYQLGMLDFVYTCRTCTDQRCVDPCEYDSIKYDRERREVVINESTCVGCTLCGQLCPYGAIEMVDVEDPDNPTYSENFKLRLDADGKLKFGPGAGRVARTRRIANKCDHCANYADQACVTACPTGALIELNAYGLFRERSEAAIASARMGYDRDVRRDRSELLPMRPFIDGAQVRDAGIAKIKRSRLGAAVIWAVGLAAWFLCLAEIGLRLYAPTNSLQYQLELVSSPPRVALLQVGFRAGDELAVWCGYIGTALMSIAILYPIVRRINMFKLIANARVWFDLHMMAGTVGPLFIVLHAANKLDNWVSIAYWSMIIVVVSGVAGRYLYTQIPDLVNGRELEELDHRRAFSGYRHRYRDLVAIAERELSAHEQGATAIARSAGVVGAFVWVVAEDLKRPLRWSRRRIAFSGTGAPGAVVRDLRNRTGRMMLIDRRRVMGSHAQLILHSWKKVHVPFSLIMAAVAVVHIWLAFKYSM
jgi:Fe-S-cluster-containing hydrogenase component 2